MAIVKNNVVTEGLSGSLGKNLVFRQRKGRTIVATSPHGSEHCSEKQKRQREKFQMATQYARGQMAIPEQKLAYDEKAREKGNGNGYNVAVADFFKPPIIERVDTTAYQGAIGDPIRILAWDDFIVEKVEVEILHEDGSSIESGTAVLQADGYEWIYQANVANENFNGDKILVKAFDHPGNETELETLL